VGTDALMSREHRDVRSDHAIAELLRAVRAVNLNISGTIYFVQNKSEVPEAMDSPNRLSDQNLRCAVVQHRCEDDTTKNLKKSVTGIRDAAAQGARLILLQELHTSLYFCQTESTAAFDLAEPVPGPTTQSIQKLAAELGIVIVASLFERRAAGLYHNTAVVLDSDGSIAGKYRKMHIPDDPGYYEKYYFTPGDPVFKPVTTSLGKLGVLVCWDQWFPEAARLMALAGADILLYPTAIGWDTEDDTDEKQRQLDAWQVIQRSHAIANNLPLMCCNRTGLEVSQSGTDQIDFWGSSFIAGQQGEILAQATVDQDDVLVVDLDLSRTEQLRRIWPYLRDRRIDAYQELLSRYTDDNS